jgi:hypothetical protein
MKTSNPTEKAFTPMQALLQEKTIQSKTNKGRCHLGI